MIEPSNDRKRKEKANRVLANKDQNVLIDNCHNYAIPLDNPREEGKAAYFVGGRGFINGSEINIS